MDERRHSVCRICHVACDLVVDLREGRVRAIHGNRDNPVYHGYSCIKGRSSAAVMELPSRLLHSVQRMPDGGFARVAVDPALADVAARLQRIVDDHGPRSVAMFIGTYASTHLVTEGFARAFMRALGSPMLFDNGTIDQPGKPMSFALHGVWLAGSPPIERWDALLLVGTNPLVSMNGGLGVNPARTLKQARARGMKLVVIDPRRTECAAQADIHLQIRPGEDAAVLAGIVRHLILSGALDDAFVAAETTGLDTLAGAVAPYTPDVVAARAGIDAAQLVAAADLIGACARGAVSIGTGGNMSGQSTIVEYLGKVLTSLRGWWLRAGEERPNPGVLIEPLPAIAGTAGPTPYEDLGAAMRVRGLRQSVAGMPTAALAEEMLTPGEGQVRALIVTGGNPLLAWPDQHRTRAALEQLDLLVCIDPTLSATARLADYVFAPTLALECETNSAVNERWRIVGPGWGYERPYAQSAPPVVDRPADSDLRDDWEFFYDLARHMGLALDIHSGAIFDPVRSAEMATPVDMANRPDTAAVWRMALNGSPVAYDDIRGSAAGALIERPVEIVRPRPADMTGRLDLAAPIVMAELATMAAGGPAPIDGTFPFRLISRRLNDVINSCGHDNPAQLRKWPYNPAFLNPDDLAALGIESGGLVEIRSAAGTITGVAQAAPDVRPGCVSMSHSWGRSPGEIEQPERDGGNTGRLAANDRDFDRVTGMPRMSAIPVTLRAAP